MINRFFGAKTAISLPRLDSRYNFRPEFRCRHPDETTNRGGKDAPVGPRGARGACDAVYEEAGRRNQFGRQSSFRFFEVDVPRCADVAIWHTQGAKLDFFRCYLDAIAGRPTASECSRRKYRPYLAASNASVHARPKGNASLHANKPKGMVQAALQSPIEMMGNMSMDVHCDACWLAKYAKLLQQFEWLTESATNLTCHVPQARHRSLDPD